MNVARMLKICYTLGILSLTFRIYTLKMQTITYPFVILNEAERSEESRAYASYNMVGCFVSGS
jgi:hypothetical protein